MPDSQGNAVEALVWVLVFWAVVSGVAVSIFLVAT